MIKHVTFIIALSMLITACEGEKMQETDRVTMDSKQSVENIPESAWMRLSKRKYYFGHQSVGYNIIDGINDIMKENPKVQINIVDTKDPSMLKEGVLAHSSVGQNTDPVSKLVDFARTMENGIGDKADYAFMKFCYVDFSTNTDVKKVFNEYRKTHDELKHKYPETTFIHVTTPLTSKQSDLKTLTKNLIKRVIGRPVRTYKDNIKRNEFNNMIRDEYNEKALVFDLAKIEATYPDGEMLKITKEGNTFPNMVPAYTYDGGHLNENGRKRIAEQLLIYLANLPEKKSDQ